MAYEQAMTKFLRYGKLLRLALGYLLRDDKWSRGDPLRLSCGLFSARMLS